MLFDSVWFNFQCLQHRTHAHSSSQPIDEISANAADCTISPIQPSHCLYARSRYTLQVYTYVALDLYWIRFDSDAAHVPSPIVVADVVPHAHNAPWYVCVTVFGRWQPMLVWLIIATYIRIIGYSVLACVCVCVLPFNQWLMLPISAHTGIERESDCAKKTVIVSMAHVLIWIKGEKNQDQKKTRHTQQHWLQNTK